MLLSIKHQFLFVHIAKTGGTSVRAVLARYRRRESAYIPWFLASRLSGLSGHRLGIKFPRHAKAIAAQEMLPQEFFDALFKFAFVRNPWDLQVSSWHHLRRERPRLVAHAPDFESFLKWKLDPQRPYQYHVDTSIQLQTDYLIDLHGNFIVNFIGHYENLADDFHHVCERLKLPPQRALPHKRRAADRGKDYRSYYSDATADLVARHFAADIERLGYRFDTPEHYTSMASGLGAKARNELQRRARDATPGTLGVTVKP